MTNILQEENASRKKRPVRSSPWPPSEDEENARRLDAENIILQSLQFSSMKERYRRIAEAHRSTFEWIFQDPPQRDRPWDNFVEWLKSGQGIYWVNGKAGSGKSTLMRFLYDDKRTKESLLTWAGYNHLDLAGFFFWNSGSLEQKSQTGLLRSLLYELLSKHRELIPVVLPKIWSDEFLKPSEYYTFFDWHIGRLKEAFIGLSKQDIVSTRVCLFIDGLDEYECEDEGSYTDIVRLFEDMTTSHTMKICLSSRPWSVFEDAFNRKAGLRLEDLTNHDISRYVDDKLCCNPMIVRMTSAKPWSAPELQLLQQEIVVKTTGVFLWSRLAIQSLLRDLADGDDIADLRERLQALPYDLEDLYEYMLEHIDPSYHMRASQIFQIVRAAPEQLEREHEQIGLLDLALADDAMTEIALHGEIKAWTVEELKYRCDELHDRLLSCCAGLLETSTEGSETFDSAVNYLHRTVKDWLDIPCAQKLLINRIAGTDFNPNASLLRSCVLQLKTVCISAKRSSFATVSKYVQEAMRNARSAADCTGQSYSIVLDQLNEAATHHWEAVPRPSTDLPKRDLRKENWCNHVFSPVIKPWRMSICPSSPCYRGASPLPKVRFEESVLPPATIQHQDSFISLSIMYGLCPYVQEKFHRNKFLVRQKSSRPLLDYIVGHKGPPSSDLVSLLLEYGADPDQSYGNQTIWQHLLSSARENLRKSEGTANFQLISKTAVDSLNTDKDGRNKEIISQWAKIFNLFIQNGANPNAACKRLERFKYKGELHWKIKTLSALSVVLESFGDIDISEAHETESILRKYGAAEFVELSEEHGFYETMVAQCKEFDGAKNNRE